MESCPKRARHQPDDHYGWVGWALSLYSPGLEAHSGRHLGGFPGLLDSKRVRRRSFSYYKRFARSRNSAICRACSSYFASISRHQRRNWSSMGGFTGLLDMAVSSDCPVGCLRMAKASEIGRSPRSWCTQPLAYRL